MFSSIWSNLRQSLIPSTVQQLIEAENKLIETTNAPNVTKSKVADLHTLHAPCQSEQEHAPPLVMCPGFGAGAAIYSHTLRDLSRQHDVYALDLLGFGQSARPSLSMKSVQETEDTFVSSLERWRVEQGLEQMTLLGHSFGGYLAACYALRHPERVHSLVMASPVGLPQPPPVEVRERRLQGYPLWARSFAAFFKFLWNFDYTPLSLVRMCGPFGPRLVDKFVSLRLPGWQEKEALSDYIFHLSAQPACGEFALPSLLEMGGWARSPLLPRLADGLQVPTTFLYGEVDWMNPEPALQLQQKLGPHRVITEILPSCGHQLFMENPDAFHAAMRRHFQRHKQ